MSYGWGPQQSADVTAARVREQAVKDVLERGMPPIAAAMTWGVQTADLERWVADARNQGRARHRDLSPATPDLTTRRPAQT